ncbi:hypothetical protein SAMD00019534_084260, partial [Acytostelium subglobosum LB1]|uniref:hypothetical protein n=1 Tax=Acytostelium subglobosum LB1 TaxID=1410327 RepID=UPI000644F113
INQSIKYIIMSLQKEDDGDNNWGMHYLVCVDESSFSLNAFHFVVKQLSKVNDSITVLHVCHHIDTPIIDPLGDTLDKVANIEEKELAQKLKNTYETEFRLIKTKVLHCKYITAIGKDTTGTIMSSIDQIKPDIVAVGSRGVSGLQRLMLGSTSQYLVDHLTIPVIIVP